MDEQTCPFCESTLHEIDPYFIPNTKSLYCETCDIQFVQYPPDNKKSGQRTGLYAFTPLAKFSKEEWGDFLFGDRNIYGEEIPDRMPIFASPEEKDRMNKLREKKLQERREWEEQVG